MQSVPRIAWMRASCSSAAGSTLNRILRSLCTVQRFVKELRWPARRLHASILVYIGLPHSGAVAQLQRATTALTAAPATGYVLPHVPVVNVVMAAMSLVADGDLGLRMAAAMRTRHPLIDMDCPINSIVRKHI